MKTVSLKIDDAIFGETEKIHVQVIKPRYRHINESLENCNKPKNRFILEQKLKGESLAILNDFEGIEYGG